MRIIPDDGWFDLNVDPTPNSKIIFLMEDGSLTHTHDAVMVRTIWFTYIQKDDSDEYILNMPLKWRYENNSR